MTGSISLQGCYKTIFPKVVAARRRVLLVVTMILGVKIVVSVVVITVVVGVMIMSADIAALVVDKAVLAVDVAMFVIDTAVMVVAIAILSTTLLGSNLGVGTLTEKTEMWRIMLGQMAMQNAVISVALCVRAPRSAGGVKHHDIGRTQGGRVARALSCRGIV